MISWYEKNSMELEVEPGKESVVIRGPEVTLDSKILSVNRKIKLVESRLVYFNGSISRWRLALRNLNVDGQVHTEQNSDL
jgi:hypothetical protein